MEAAGWHAKQAAVEQVYTDIAADLHNTEVLGSHPGRPTPSEAVGRGVTPASGAGHGVEH